MRFLDDAQTLVGEVFDTTGGIAPAMPNDLAACQVTPGSEWILAKVISYDQEMYTLSDEDVESDKSTYIMTFL